MSEYHKAPVLGSIAIVLAAAMGLAGCAFTEEVPRRPTGDALLADVAGWLDVSVLPDMGQPEHGGPPQDGRMGDGGRPPQDSSATDTDPRRDGTPDVDPSTGCMPTGFDETKCDGIDDDCDGRLDEHFARTVVHCGSGVCASVGINWCANGAEEHDCQTGEPSASDRCNDLDDDCDGRVDEDARRIEETCNDADDDCDGRIDEAPCNDCTFGVAPPFAGGWSTELGGHADTWVCIPASANPWFVGSPADEHGRFPEVEARRMVELSYDFYIQARETTAAQWRAVTGQWRRWEGPDCPTCSAHRVGWAEAVAFANRRSVTEGLTPCYRCIDADGDAQPIDWPDAVDGGDGARNGNGNAPLALPCDLRFVKYEPATCDGYRLPTEAEWEVAARSRSLGPFAAEGLMLNDAVLEDTCPQLPALDAWAVHCATSRQISAPRPFDQPARRATRWGLFDVHGNACEWTSTWFAVAPMEGGRNPLGPQDERVLAEPGAPVRRLEQKVCRGGSWDEHPRRLRFARRRALSPEAGDPEVGLRLVRTIVER